MLKLQVSSAVLCIALGASAALAQGTYPNRPIRLLIGFTPGGATDLVGRLVAEKYSERFGQQVVVDNRPGASGIIAARRSEEHTSELQSRQ